MDLDKLTPKQQKIFKEKLNYYIDVAKFGIDSQSDSVSALDSKTDIILATLGLLTATSVAVFSINADFVDTLSSYSNMGKILLGVFCAIYFLCVIANFVLGYMTINTIEFFTGRTVQRVRDIDNLGVSNIKILKDIADGYELSYLQNIDLLAGKLRLMKWTSRLWVVNLIFTILFIIIVSFS